MKEPTMVTSSLNGNTIDVTDPVQHPSHYTAYGAEVIDITKYMSFCRGNVVKYCCRAGLKSKSTELEDLLKAKQYLEWEIDLVQKKVQNEKK